MAWYKPFFGTLTLATNLVKNSYTSKSCLAATNNNNNNTINNNNNNNNMFMAARDLGGQLRANISAYQSP